MLMDGLKVLNIREEESQCRWCAKVFRAFNGRVARPLPTRTIRARVNREKFEILQLQMSESLCGRQIVDATCNRDVMRF